MTTFQTIKNLYAAGSKAEAFTAHKADPSGLAVSFESFCTKMDLILKLKNSEPAVPGKTICYQEMGESTEAVLQYSCSHRSGYYVTTDLDLKGRGIRQTGDGSDHKRGKKTYHMTERALEILKAQQSYCYVANL